MSGQDHNVVPMQDTLSISELSNSPDTLDSMMDSVHTVLFVGSGPTQTPDILEVGFNLIDKVRFFHPTWLFIYLFVLLSIFAWVRLYYGNILDQTYQASTSFQVASRMFKDNSLLQKQLDNILYGFYFLSIAFLLYLGEQRLNIEPYGLQGGSLYLFSLGLLVVVFFGRIVLVNLSGFLFNRLKTFREYLYNSFIFNKLLGIVILPLLLFMVYTSGTAQEIFHWAALVTVSLVILMRVIRGIIFSFKRDVLIFYMFLYLCALEILPLALLYKWLEGIL